MEGKLLSTLNVGSSFGWTLWRQWHMTRMFEKRFKNLSEALVYGTYVLNNI
jgi:hypothetical protein